MEKFKSKSLGMDIVVRDYTETDRRCCGNCYYWDDRTAWCDERRSTEIQTAYGLAKGGERSLRKWASSQNIREGVRTV